MQTVESVCSTLGLRLGQTWESYLMELPKLSWTSLFLSSLELEHHEQDMEEPVLYALYYGHCAFITNDFTNTKDPIEAPENIIRKDEKQVDLDYVINEIQNKFYF